MKSTLSGVKVTGTWGDVVELGERITKALTELDIPYEKTRISHDEYTTAMREWQEWRPRYDESDMEVREKTAEQVSIKKNTREKDGVQAREDIQEARTQLRETYENIDGDVEKAGEAWSEGVSHALWAANTAGRRAVRSIEDFVYREIMMSISPYYFDNKLLSANLSTSSDGFTLEVNINDDEVLELFLDHIDDSERWHSESEKVSEVEAESSTAEAAEGVTRIKNNK